MGELAHLLASYWVETLVDIRSVPRSRKNPQFNVDVLPAELANVGMRYVHLAPLGGLRRKSKGAPSHNTGWQVESFRNYADYAQTEPFAQGLDALVALAAQSACALMCAEAVWWRCHRRIVADYLLVRGITVRHILSAGRAEDATMTPFATRAPDGTLTYPSGDPYGALME